MKAYIQDNSQEIIAKAEASRPKPKKSNKAWYLLFLAPIAFFFVFSAVAESDADVAFREAQEAYSKALSGHCSTIGAKTLDCYTGGDCQALQESINWFQGEDGYGQPPEVACKNLTAKKD